MNTILIIYLIVLIIYFLGLCIGLKDVKSGIELWNEGQV